MPGAKADNWQGSGKGITIGLTGPMGAGKTTAARILQSFGACVIDADLIGRDVVDGSLAIRRRLAKTFGGDVLTKSGVVKREELARRAFATQLAKARLDSIVHPALLRALKSQIKHDEKECLRIVIDAALLFDWDLDKICTLSVVIMAPARMRLQRLVDKGFERADARLRMKGQLPESEYRSRADVVIENVGDTLDLTRKLRRFWVKLPQYGG